jgi:hypothetical protein
MDTIWLAWLAGRQKGGRQRKRERESERERERKGGGGRGEEGSATPRGSEGGRRGEGGKEDPSHPLVRDGGSAYKLLHSNFEEERGRGKGRSITPPRERWRKRLQASAFNLSLLLMEHSLTLS